MSSSGTLKHPVFVRFLSSMALSSLAYQMLVVAVGWQVYDLTHSALNLGLIGLMQFTPQLLLTLVVGHVADRYDRRLIVVTTRSVQAILVAVLAIGSWQAWINIHGIFACAFLLGATRAFESPAQQALLPSLIDSSHLPRALALNSSLREASVIIGPAMGGFLYALHPEMVYWCSSVSFLLASVAMSLIPKPERIIHREPPTLRSVFAGFSYIRHNPVVLGAMSLDLFSVLLGGATALLPIFARDILHTGPWGLGLLRAAPSVGAVLMSLVLARHTIKRHAGMLMFAAVATFGVATIIFGLSQSFLVSFSALLILGASDMISVVIRSSLIQLETPDAMRGRVSAVNFIFIGASNQLGEFESGVTAAWWGVVPAVIVGGLGTLMIVGLWMKFFPELTRRQELTKAIR
ncbi:MFS transporter [Tolumonas lignilytica]|uniref:MFS transporter n=1 Tax=Tolumonas lignilytica TaxID=1283284 RepID=UPI00046524A5|nr:MFS transporter [Tolumonas lignilytica]